MENPLDGPEVFGVVVRTVGLLATLYGIWCLAFAVAITIRAATPDPNNEPRSYYTAAITFIFVGGGLFLGADAVVRLGYPS
jgi:hypothetical protein